eukprot:TRINITY_DN11183_c0_g1_i1.p1 TRINITY_DN11183_c0_g1~~TRINITY_DN11183_c0_g1_i1.p1  ORF type:complete len:115 (-),score=21.69 TRINITY_DN11183_c0_g1_i1:163-507(-)
MLTLKHKPIDQAQFSNVVNEIEDFDSYIEEREKDIITIHQQMQTVNQMFVEIATLVEMQAPLVNNIAANISSSASNVRVARQEIEECEMSLFERMKNFFTPKGDKENANKKRKN